MTVRRMNRFSRSPVVPSDRLVGDRIGSELDSIWKAGFSLFGNSVATWSDIFYGGEDE